MWILRNIAALIIGSIVGASVFGTPFGGVIALIAINLWAFLDGVAGGMKAK